MKIKYSLKAVAVSTLLTLSACSITPHHAVSTNDLKYLRNMPASEVNSGPYGSSDWTPLHVAVVNNNIAAMDILLEKGANPNAYSYTMGVAPIHSAVHAGHVASLKKLLSLNVDLNIKNKGGATPLELSIIRGNILIFDLLLNGAVNIEETSNIGLTPLYVAASYNRVDMVKSLVELGAKLEKPDDTGTTPLIASIMKQNPSVTRILVAAGANLDHKNGYGDTALHWAANHKNYELLKLLIDAGANVSLRNSAGRTAKDLIEGFPALISLFPKAEPTHKEEVETEPTAKPAPAPEQKTKPEPVYFEKPHSKPKLIGSGSSFMVNAKGGVITNHHVIDQCNEVKIFRDSKEYEAKVRHVDYKNDLAYLSSPKLAGGNYVKVESEQQLLGERLVVLGYPLTGLMGNTIKLTDGSLSSLTGLGGDASNYQISAPIQAGNSGGPVFNEQGNVVGVASSSLNTFYMLKTKQDAPQNVNFAVKSSLLVSFMSANNIEYFESTNDSLSLSPKDIFSNNASSDYRYSAISNYCKRAFRKYKLRYRVREQFLSSLVF